MISACILTRNEEKNIVKVLENIKDFVDEIVILDAESTDKTRGICERFGCRIFTEPWRDDFSYARNRLLDLAQGDWVLFVDADETLEPELLKNLRGLIERTEHPIVAFKRFNYIDGEKVQPYPDYQCRLIRKNSGAKYVGRVHEGIPKSYERLYTNFHIVHRKTRKQQDQQTEYYVSLQGKFSND